MEWNEDEDLSFDEIGVLELERRFPNEDIQEKIASVLNTIQRFLNGRWPDDGNGEDDAESLVRNLFRTFLDWKDLHGRSRDESVEQLVIYGIAKICYWNWIQDSTLVGQILDGIYNCDSHFSGLFLHVIDYTLSRRAQNSFDLKEYTVLLYFVHHAQKAQLLFNEVRFIDLNLHFQRVPLVIMAAVYAKPRPLALLLKYGALLQPATVHRDQMNDFGSDWGIPELLKHLLCELWASIGTDLENVASTTMQNVCSCLRLLLRVIPQLF